jgi:hypothetical protein
LRWPDPQTGATTVRSDSAYTDRTRRPTMGMITEGNIITQLKKGQGETNDLLDRLIAAQERTNQFLEWVGGYASGKPADPK